MLDPIKVKGKEALIPIFKPLRDARAEEGSGNPGKLTAGRRPMRANARRSVLGAKDNFDSGARVLAGGAMRTREREELFEILDSLYLHGAPPPHPTAAAAALFLLVLVLLLCVRVCSKKRGSSAAGGGSAILNTTQFPIKAPM